MSQTLGIKKKEIKKVFHKIVQRGLLRTFGAQTHLVPLIQQNILLKQCIIIVLPQLKLIRKNLILFIYTYILSYIHLVIWVSF